MNSARAIVRPLSCPTTRVRVGQVSHRLRVALSQLRVETMTGPMTHGGAPRTAASTTLPAATSNEKDAGESFGTVMIAVVTPAVAAGDVRVTVVGVEVAAIGRAAKVGVKVVTTDAETAAANHAPPVTTSIPKPI